MNFSKLYGKNITPSCQYCLYYVESAEQPGTMICDRGKDTSNGNVCKTFRYEPTLREPKEQPLLAEFSPEDFKI